MTRATPVPSDGSGVTTSRSLHRRTPGRGQLPDPVGSPCGRLNHGRRRRVHRLPVRPGTALAPIRPSRADVLPARGQPDVTSEHGSRCHLGDSPVPSARLDLSGIAGADSARTVRGKASARASRHSEPAGTDQTTSDKGCGRDGGSTDHRARLRTLVRAGSPAQRLLLRQSLPRPESVTAGDPRATATVGHRNDNPRKISAGYD
jgi:hypothetical protein